MYSDAVALTIYANSRLAGLECPGFWPNAVVFQWKDKITFEALTGRFLAAEDPETWVDMLRSRGVVGFHVHSGGGHPIAEAFAGGGSRWVVEAIHQDQIECWIRVSRDIRECRFVRRSTDQECPVHERQLDVVAEELKLAILRAQSLLEPNRLGVHPDQLSWFDTRLKGALAALSSDSPKSPFMYSELESPSNLSLPAGQLLAACGEAWLFGGMGSWNDVIPIPTAKEEYEGATNDLYRLVIEGICIAANTSFPNPVV